MSVHIDGVKKGYYKVTLPWRIKTPQGYSSLISESPPLLRFKNDYTVMPAIIDTDEYDLSSYESPIVSPINKKLQA